MVKSAQDRIIPRNERHLVSTYHRSLRTLKRRIQRKSVRRVAREIGVSHPTLLAMMDGRDVSRKTMVRIIQKTTGKPRKRFQPVVGYWFPDSV